MSWMLAGREFRQQRGMIALSWVVSGKPLCSMCWAEASMFERLVLEGTGRRFSGLRVHAIH